MHHIVGMSLLMPCEARGGGLSQVTGYRLNALGSTLRTLLANLNRELRTTGIFDECRILALTRL
jgi:hypothetical protein